MKMSVRNFQALCLLVATLWIGQAGAKAPPPDDSLAPMVDRVLPAVVNISTRSNATIQSNPLLNDPFFRHFFGDLYGGRGIPQPSQRQNQSLGSGVIVDAAKGWVVTNHHVIDQADEITVTLRDKRNLKAELIGSDPETDIAVLKIDAENLVAVEIGDSNDLRVGDFVVAMGNPFGLGQTVTYGIISALGRSGLGVEGYENFIQTDASINPGNSGGALVTTQGELVGINTAIIGPNGGNVGIGFAVPTAMMKAVVEQIVDHGEVRRGQLGVLIQDLTTDLAKAFGLEQQAGVLVSQIVEGSAAQKSGLQEGDVIIGVNGQHVSNSAELRNLIGMQRLGNRVRIKLIRNAEPLQLTVRLSKRDPDVALGPETDKVRGLTLGAIPPDHPLQGQVTGVAVLQVDPNSRAWQAGIRAGDVIRSINQQPLSQADDAVKRLESGERSLLHIVRPGGALYVML
ncbi:DegQ family serine endoprotease [Motiliproteus sp.]|uniref:DegQ family serine endoprotease n=1 Tax=Motiliproteus sp. TaxID=1898955 RepID=UPI003BACF8FA